MSEEIRRGGERVDLKLNLAGFLFPKRRSGGSAGGAQKTGCLAETRNDLEGYKSWREGVSGARVE